ncbi:MAG TPA: aromatic-ring-hydroxylating dioxygenase subunit beta [Steroidobacteraceae bacterium]|jgi:salicylate 5-hydroxylase small subunit|nr:aromatic-ring-hydroxylating dioxygenase subunit beta [Steroidobacteraceae bacterium]
MNAEIELRLNVADLYASYSACLDAGRFDDWPEFFTEDCRYRVVSRENHDRNLPLGTMDLQSRGALLDRVYAVQSTLFHAPYYQRHIIGPARILSREGETILAEANYLVIRTKRDQPSEVFNAGRYLDRIVAVQQGLRFVDKLCIFDSELIPNSIIYPL